MASDESSTKAVGMKKTEEIIANGGNSTAVPPHFVLVHGSGGGAWSWYKIKCLLENACGYSVSCFDLTGAGNDLTDPKTVLTFEQYNKPLVDFLCQLPPNQQVILVGHSAGGLSLSDAINRFGKKKIKLAVFIAATMLKFGFLTDEDIRIGVPEMYGNPKEAQRAGMNLEEDQTSLKLEHECPLKPAYKVCPLEDYTLAQILSREGPLQALTTAKFEEGEDLEKVARVYIKTTHDQVLKPYQQEAMIQKWPPAAVYEVESDHSPLFSAPILLVSLLRKAALRYG